MEEPASNSDASEENSEDGSSSQRQEMSEERRLKLREIEVGYAKITIVFVHVLFLFEY